MESRKLVLDEPSGRAGIKMQTLRTDLRTQRGKGRLGCSERVALTYIHYQMDNR